MSHNKSSRGLQFDRTFSTLSINGGDDCVGKRWDESIDMKIKGGALIRKTICTRGLVTDNLNIQGNTYVENTLDGNPGTNLTVKGNTVVMNKIYDEKAFWDNVIINGNLNVDGNVTFYDDDVKMFLNGNCLLDGDLDTFICANNNDVLIQTSGILRAKITDNGSFELHRTSAPGMYSFSEGNATIASGFASHAQGYQTTASGRASSSEGFNTISGGRASHAESDGNTNDDYSHVEAYVYSGNIGFASHIDTYSTEMSSNICHVEGDCEVFSPLTHVDTCSYAWNDSEVGLDHFEGDSMYNTRKRPESNVTQTRSGLSHCSPTIGYNFGYCSHISRGGHVVANSGEYTHVTGRGTFASQHAQWALGTNDNEDTQQYNIYVCEDDIHGDFQVSIFSIRACTDGGESGNLYLKVDGNGEEVYPLVDFMTEPLGTAHQFLGNTTEFDGVFNQNLQVINGTPAAVFHDNNEIYYAKSEDIYGNVWLDNSTIYSNSGVSIRYTSFANICGVPAICFKEDSGTDTLRFLKSDDIDGNVWGNSVIVQQDTGSSLLYTYLAEVNGNVAIAYVDSGELKYTRSTDSSGTIWLPPVTIDSGNSAASSFQKLSIKIADGNPAISYFVNTSGGLLNYVRASDPNGDSWNTPQNVDTLNSNIGFNPTMEIINGNPAVIYTSTSRRMVFYVRANDSTGSSWGMPILLDTSTFFWRFIDPSLTVICGRPAVMYLADRSSSTYALRYIRANDIDGSSWPSDQTIARNIRLYGCTLKEVDESPAVVGRDLRPSPDEIVYLKSRDCGDTWPCVYEFNNTIHQAWMVDLTISGKDTVTKDCFGQKIRFTVYHNESGNSIIIANVQKGTEFSMGTLIGSNINIDNNGKYIVVQANPSSSNKCHWSGTMYVTNVGTQDYVDRYFTDFYITNG